MIKQLLIAWALMASSVAIHATGIVAALKSARRHEGRASWTFVFVGLAGWIILLHVAEIAVWGAVYTWRGAMPDLASAP